MLLIKVLSLVAAALVSSSSAAQSKKGIPVAIGSIENKLNSMGQAIHNAVSIKSVHSHKSSSKKHAVHAVAPKKSTSSSSSSKPTCRSYTETFKKAKIVEDFNYNGNPSSADFINLSGSKSLYAIGSKGLEMILKAPKNPDPQKGYNKNAGSGMTFNATHLMHYGSITYELQAIPVGGIVTAAILLAPGGDEMDVEIIGSDMKNYQSNMFYHGIPEYGVYSAKNPVKSSVGTGFHKYKMEWTPEAVTWSVDGKVSHVLQKNATKEKDGKYHFPSEPAYPQFGVWDSSFSAGTTAWAGGPVNWKKTPSTLKGYMKSITFDCDPKYNKVIH